MKNYKQTESRLREKLEVLYDEKFMIGDNDPTEFILDREIKQAEDRLERHLKISLLNSERDTHTRGRKYE